MKLVEIQLIQDVSNLNKKEILKVNGNGRVDPHVIIVENVRALLSFNETLSGSPVNRLISSADHTETRMYMYI